MMQRFVNRRCLSVMWLMWFSSNRYFFSKMILPCSHNVHSVTGTSVLEIWAAADFARILHWDVLSVLAVIDLFLSTYLSRLSRKKLNKLNSLEFNIGVRLCRRKKEVLITETAWDKWVITESSKTNRPTKNNFKLVFIFGSIKIELSVAIPSDFDDSMTTWPYWTFFTACQCSSDMQSTARAILRICCFFFMKSCLCRELPLGTFDSSSLLLSWSIRAVTFKWIK